MTAISVLTKALRIKLINFEIHSSGCIKFITWLCSCCCILFKLTNGTVFITLIMLDLWKKHFPSRS